MLQTFQIQRRKGDKKFRLVQLTLREITINLTLSLISKDLPYTADSHPIQRKISCCSALAIFNTQVCPSVGLSIGWSSETYKTNYKTLQKINIGRIIHEASAVCRSFLDGVFVFDNPVTPSIGLNHVSCMLNQKPACLTRTPISISAQQNLHVCTKLIKEPLN